MHESDFQYTHEPAADRDARRWAMFIHLAGVIVVTSIPLAGILAPLIIWLAKRDEHPFIDDQGRAVLDFHISMAIYFTLFIVVNTILTLLIVGIFLWLLLPLVWLVEIALSIYGAVQASDGVRYRYPGAISFLS